MRRSWATALGVVKFLVHATRDPNTRARTFWFAVGIGINVTIIGIGAGYALASTRATPYVDGFRVLRYFMPFGLYPHGWIMVILGLTNMWGLAQLQRGFDRRGWRLVKITGRLILAYNFFVMVCMVGAIWVNHQYSAGFWWYLFVAILEGAVVSLPPTFRARIGASEVDRA